MDVDMDANPNEADSCSAASQLQQLQQQAGTFQPPQRQQQPTMPTIDEDGFETVQRRKR